MIPELAEGNYLCWKNSAGGTMAEVVVPYGAALLSVTTAEDAVRRRENREKALQQAVALGTGIDTIEMADKFFAYLNKQ